MVWLFVVSERAGEQSRGSGTLRISASSPSHILSQANCQRIPQVVLGKLVHHKSRRRWKYSQMVITSSPHTKSLNGWRRRS